jgi:chromate reductase
VFIANRHGRHVSPTLLNALDIGAHGDSIWADRPAAIVPVRTGLWGDLGAGHCLRRVLTRLRLALMDHPQISIGGADDPIRKDRFGSETSELYCTAFMDAFTDWVQRHPVVDRRAAPARE